MDKSTTSVFVLSLVFLLAALMNLGLLSSYGGLQDTFILDIDAPNISYNLSKINSSVDSLEFDFPTSGGNQTINFALPKNSTVSSVSMSLEGELTSIYEKSVVSSGGFKGLIGLSAGNVTPDGNVEIAVGNDNLGDGIVRVLYGENGSEIWTASVCGPTYDVLSTDIGNVSSQSGGEVAVGCSNGKISLLNSTGGPIWSNSTGSNNVNSVKIGDIDSDGSMEVVLGSGTLVYSFSSLGQQEWNASVSCSINGIAIGNLTDDPGMEVASSCGNGDIKVINSTGNVTRSIDLSEAINTIDIGNVSSSPGNEMVVGTSDKIYVLNSTGGELSNYTTNSVVYSVRIGELTTDFEGNEIFAGCDDQKIYILNSSANLIGKFSAGGYVKTVGMGDLVTNRSGNEGVGGGADGKAYVFNFDDFPTSLSLDVGGDGSKEWNSSYTKLRTTEVASDSTIASAINTYLASCTNDSSGNCIVPIVFSSSWQGRLNISSVLLRYSYNTSSIFSKNLSSGWSRRDNISAGEVIGSQVHNITFLGIPAENVTVRYLKIPGGSSSCDFNFTSKSVTTIGSDTVCDISSTPLSFPANQTISSSVNSYLLWYDSLSTYAPINISNTSGFYLTSGGPGNYTKLMNISANATNGTFTNVILNWTVNDSQIVGDEFLRVLDGTWCDLTPENETGSCDSSSPAYSLQKSCSSYNFSVCKKMLGNATFFKWAQSLLSSGSPTAYQAGGSYNHKPVLSNMNVSKNTSIWGETLNFSVDVYDEDGDSVNVSLWVNRSASWAKVETKSGSGGVLQFNITTDKSWTGNDSYRFEYFDYNSSALLGIHFASNTSSSNFNVSRHDVEVLYTGSSSGNDSEMFRNETKLLSIFVNDTNSSANVSGASCALWINGTLASSNTTNSSGYCNVYLSPNQSFSPSQKSWIIGVLNDLYYNNGNSTGLDITIRGWLRPQITNSEGFSFYRGAYSQFEAVLLDEYNQTSNLSTYNCSFALDSSSVGSNNTSAGNCSIYYQAGCAGVGSSVGPKNLSMNISRTGGEDYYNISFANTSIQATLMDMLNVSISEPLDQNYYAGDTIALNASVNDSCQSLPGVGVSWGLVRKNVISINITDLSSKSRQNYPVIISGEMLSDDDYSLSDFRISNAKLLLNGSEVPIFVFPWMDSSKSALNTSQQYLNGSSEILFFVNLSEGSNKTYILNVTSENAASYGNGSYNILNAGFDAGNLSYWSQSSHINVGSFAQTSSAGSDTYANISADAETLVLTQNLSNFTFPTTVYIRYRAMGTYNNSGQLSDFHVALGNATCNLTQQILGTLDGNGRVIESSNWTLANCTDSSFSSAGNISIVISDSGNSGSYPGTTIALIDYICFGNSSGSCTNFHSGALLDIGLITKKEIGNLTNYTIEGSDEVGRRKIAAQAQAEYYAMGKSFAFFNITGFSKVHNLTLLSGFCTQDSVNTSYYRCMSNASFELNAKITNNYTNESIEGYNVSFYNNSTAMGENTTSSAGIAAYSSVLEAGLNFTFYANITSQPEIFYSISAESGKGISVEIDDGQTNGTLALNATNASASGISLDMNYTLPISMVLLNNGTSGMYSISMAHSSISGISIPAANCTSLVAGANCTSIFNITITTNASVGNHTISFNVTWLNGNGNSSNLTTSMTITVDPTPRVVFQQENLTIHAPVTVITPEGIALLNYGNTNLTGVYFNINGTDSAAVSAWAGFSSNATSIVRGGSSNVTLSFDIPKTAAIRAYYINLTATIPNCTSNCSDVLPIILNVTPLDWSTSPEYNLSKTVGLKAEVNKFGEVNITSILDSGVSFNVSISPMNGTSLNFLSLNATSNATSVQVLVPASSSEKVQIFYNTSISPNTTGAYNYTLQIASLDNSTQPQSANISLYFEIINFTVDLISPTEGAPLGTPAGINANDTISVEAEAMMGSSPISTNITWTVLVGGSECVQESAVYNVSSQTWMIQCQAPDLSMNPINNSIEIIGNYTDESVELSDTEEHAVIYDDVLSPWFSNVSANSLNYFLNTSQTSFEVNVTDNRNIVAVWAVITGPTGQINLTAANYTRTGRSYEGFDDFDSYIYTFNFSSPGAVGDYDITMHASDNDGHQNTSLGWFEIYEPIAVYSNFTDSDGSPINANLTFYRNGYTSSEIYRMDNTSTTGGNYNRTLHKRAYDVKVEAFGQEVILKDMDFDMALNSTANPFRIDYFPNKTSSDITNMELPDTANRQSILTAIVVESALDVSGADFAMNYTNALNAGSFTENLLEVFVCANWSYESRTCTDGTFSYLAGTSNLTQSNPDTSRNMFNFSSSHLSAYAIAESSYPDKWGVSPIINNPTQQPTGGGGSSRSSTDESTGDKTKIFCGNGICELGENADNCPDDCSKEFPLITDTNLDDVNIFPGESKSFWLTLENPYDRNFTAILDLSENLKDLIYADKHAVDVNGKKTERINLSMNLSRNQTIGTFGGNMIISAGGVRKNLPVTIRIVEKADSIFTIQVELMSNQIAPGERLDFVVKMANLGDKRVYPIGLTYLVKNPRNREVLKEYRSNLSLETTSLISESLDINLSDEGAYTLEVWANYNEKNIMDVATFEIVRPLFQSPATVALVVLALVMIVAVGGTQLLKYYEAWKKEKEKQQRYFYPLDYNTVPKEGFKIGKFAARDNFFYYDPKDLSTHIIVAGATGAGKSVSASLFAEEALDKKIPVIVFDPTAQWTGFVKPCKDKNLLSRYSKFGMDDFDIKSYPGLIYDIETPNFRLDIKRFINPGEITIFCLNKLKPGEYDVAVNNIIAAIFRNSWEESTELKIVIVFDEVHRLLEKYGGSGGYVALEKAAREFRKWGIGVIMCSQVLADFKEAISGNVLTEVQLNTKSLEDIDKVKVKYGEKYSDRITRMGVGAGLVQYPKYNNGKPFFVEFRPTKHDPHKITDQELALYKNYTQRLDAIGLKIEAMKRRGTYTENYEIDYKLALDKLKRGNFRMADIYITSLERSLENVLV